MIVSEAEYSQLQQTISWQAQVLEMSLEALETAARRLGLEHGDTEGVTQIREVLDRFDVGAMMEAARSIREAAETERGLRLAGSTS